MGTRRRSSIRAVSGCIQSRARSAYKSSRKHYEPDTSLLPVHMRDITEARSTFKFMASALPDIRENSHAACKLSH